MRAAFVLATALLGSVSALQSCDLAFQCDYNVTVGGKEYYYDFFPACRSNGLDYHAVDAGGHDYYANICGTASAICLPHDWQNTYEFGVAVQLWGDDPPCEKDEDYCIPKDQPDKVMCCTRDCQVLGVGPPIFSLVDPTDANGGVLIQHEGAQPAKDDPFWCPWDPATGQQFPRTVTYLMQCEHSTHGAFMESARENSTESCEYTLIFNSPYACGETNPHGAGKSGISGGSIFLILFFVTVILYVAGGMAFSYSKTHSFSHPHAQFWDNFGGYVAAGFGFITTCASSSRFSGGAGGGAGGGPAAGGASAYSDINPAASSTTPVTGSSGTSYTDL